MRALFSFGVVMLFLPCPATRAGDLKSGPEEKMFGAFDVKAVTGEMKGKTLAYIFRFNGEARPAVVVIFTRKADDHVAKLVQAADEIHKDNPKLGTLLVGFDGVTSAELEALDGKHKLETPLVIARDREGHKGLKLNKAAAVTVIVYKKDGTIQLSLGCRDTKGAAGRVMALTHAIREALKE